MNQTAETTNGLPCVGVADLVDSGSATGDSKVLPPLSVGEMTLRFYAALNYSRNSAHDLRHALNGA